jgi:hypothetical protein
MSFGGRLSSYQWQKGSEGRAAPRRMQPAMDEMVRGLIGQMAKPPETAIATPLQQATSNLQSGDPGRAFGLGNSMVDRMAGREGAPGTSTAGGGLAPGSLLPSDVGPHGEQSRADLGLPDRSSYFTFMPSADDIAKIGLSPVRSSIKNKDQLNTRIANLTQRQSDREAAGKPTTGVEKKLAKAKGRLAANTGDLYYPK